MELFPAIDIYGGKAVRLVHGDYAQMTIYNDNPLSVAQDFIACGAKNIHIVDLEGAKDGTTPNIEVIRKIISETGLFAEVGGGIRSMDVLEKYFEIGVGRAILGTAAVTNEEFLLEAVSAYGEKIAVGADVMDGYVRIKGWIEKSEYTLDAFFEKMQKIGVKTIICTDISKDGAMRGTNLEMYRDLSEKYSLDIIASGGVSSISDVEALSKMKLHGAIIGKAYYTGAINIAEAISVGEKYDN
jgi:phosphoribosylformimino-5-aminoimidazole carboxamide ribotide isomerase